MRTHTASDTGKVGMMYDVGVFYFEIGPDDTFD